MRRGEWQGIFGDNLTSILEEKGVSQKQLSRDTGLSIGMISDYINKFATPGVTAIVNLAYALDMEVDELIDFGEPIDD